VLSWWTIYFLINLRVAPFSLLPVSDISDLAFVLPFSRRFPQLRSFFSPRIRRTRALSPSNDFPRTTPGKIVPPTRLPFFPRGIVLPNGSHLSFLSNFSFLAPLSFPLLPASTSNLFYPNHLCLPRGDLPSCCPLFVPFFFLFSVSA